MTMKRQKSQLLFNFLPDDTFNHARNGTIGKVSWIYEDRRSKVKDLPKGYLLRRIRPYVERWPNDVPLRPDTVELVAPDGASFDIFPRVFECRDCGTCTSFRKDQIESGGPPQCGYCNKKFGDTEQLQFVTVCSCGTIDSVPVPSCSSCGQSNPRFRRPTSRMREAYWECPDCDQRIGDAYVAMRPCEYCGNSKQIKVHSSSTTFYPQTANFVNAEDKDLNSVARSEEFQKETIANYLLDQETSSNQSSSEADVDQEVLDALGISKEEYLEKKEEVDEERESEREDIKKWVSNTFDDGRQRAVGEEVFEYQSLADNGDINETSLEQLREDAKNREDIEEATIKDYVEAKDDLNISTVSQITDFPITTVVYGFSRLNPGPDEGSNLNTFRGSDGNDRMFAQTAEAEAVMFSLDPESVLEWLDANGVLNEWPKDHDEWFLKNLREYPYYDEVNPEEDTQVARYTLTLLHTLSHTVMTAVDALSGYSKDSLVEYLLPHTLSFVIYKRSDTDFSLGAMHTLVEERFLQMADYIESDADVCIYDPVCESEENAACEDCLYISNISCDNGNHNLSRSTLYGGAFDDADDIDGFLDISVKENV